jgi:putative membrane protein
VAFALALATLVGALDEPMDSLADRWLWVHMAQHVLLISVAAPLLVISAPWARLSGALPLGVRRPALRWAAHDRAARHLRMLARRLQRAPVAWAVFTLDLAAWHLPAAYDLALRSEPVHDVEHLCFLLTGIVVWRIILPRRRDSASASARRIALALGVMGSNWGLAIAMASAGRPWYAPYANRVQGAISALTDQHLAAGVMWVPAGLPFAAAVFVLAARALRADDVVRPPSHHAPAASTIGAGDD